MHGSVDVTDIESKVFQSDVAGQPAAVEPSPQYDTYLSSGAIVGFAGGAELVVVAIVGLVAGAELVGAVVNMVVVLKVV